jgi:ATP-dependent DNA helicase UvrD/PcrA
MPLTPAFKRAYAGLNPRQKKAVDALEGPVMVIAGPGTGKTQVLTLRIANILARTQAEPRNILALTFTEKAAFNMRERLVQLIGQTAYGVHIGTFHAFCNEVIGQNPDSFPHIIGGVPLADGEQLEIIEALLESDRIDLLRPAGRPESYVAHIGQVIGDIKGKGYSPKQFTALVKKTKEEPKRLQRMRELASVYERYQTELMRINRYDYTDMLVQVAAALHSDRNLRLDLAEQYHYILVDEHQDTNRTQNRIVQLIAEHDGPPNICVVGDLAQAIYRFQGASPENFRDFSKRYPSCTVIELDANYRSSQVILDAARGIVPAQGHLRAQLKHASHPLALYGLSSPSVMEYAAARFAADAIREGTPPENIAILYRTNAEADGLATALERMGIPYTVQSDQEVLGDSWIMKLLTIARAAHHIGDNQTLLEALQVDILGVSPLDSAKIGIHARTQHCSPWDIIRSQPMLKRIAVEDPQAILEMYALLKKIARILANNTAIAGLQAVVEHTGWIPKVTSSVRGHETMTKLHALFDAIRNYTAGRKRARLGDFLNALDRMERHGIDLNARIHEREGAVQCMTVHKAKGLEFDHVVILNVIRGHWDDVRKPPSLPLPDVLRDHHDDPNEDTRRLLYVAATRAKKQLALVWPQRGVDGKDRQISSFVSDIPDHLTTVVPTPMIERAFINHLTTAVSDHGPLLCQKEYIAELMHRQPLSVTALNNFLACPWKYYFSNLIRIPETPTPKSEYGTAAHHALRIFFDRLSKGAPAHASHMMGAFRSALKRAPLAPHIIAQLDRRGTAALTAWHAQWKGSWPLRVHTETRIERVELAPGVSITGTPDKIEVLPHGQVNVVDYKTKEPMSANAIKGLTASSTGNEYRQLLFYKLLLDGAGKWRMESGEIDFLEPNTSGKYKKERFPITTEMTHDLHAQIIDIVDRIRTLSFWNTRCHIRNCRYCRLRSMME